MIKRYFVVFVFFLLVIPSIVPLSFGYKLSEKETFVENNSTSQSLNGPMDSAWPMFRHDLYHNGYSTSTGPNTNSTLWEYTTGDYVGSSPAVADGRVYISSQNCNLYCLDAASGSKIWDFTKSYGVLLWSSPAVADGKVYIGSDDGKVYCFDGENRSPSAPIVDGPNNGLPFLTYTFTFTSTDSDGDDVSYYIDWGDCSVTCWTSYQPSGSPGYSESHSWSGFDKYIIRTKAKDINGLESPWTEYSFSTPRNRVSGNSLFLRFLERFPNAFPILRYFVRGG